MCYLPANPVAFCFLNINLNKILSVGIVLYETRIMFLSIIFFPVQNCVLCGFFGFKIL